MLVSLYNWLPAGQRYLTIPFWLVLDGSLICSQYLQITTKKNSYFTLFMSVYPKLGDVDTLPMQTPLLFSFLISLFMLSFSATWHRTGHNQDLKMTKIRKVQSLGSAWLAVTIKLRRHSKYHSGLEKEKWFTKNISPTILPSWVNCSPNELHLYTLKPQVSGFTLVTTVSCL